MDNTHTKYGIEIMAPVYKLVEQTFSHAFMYTDTWKQVAMPVFQKANVPNETVRDVLREEVHLYT